MINLSIGTIGAVLGLGASYLLGKLGVNTDTLFLTSAGTVLAFVVRFAYRKFKGG